MFPKIRFPDWCRRHPVLPSVTCPSTVAVRRDRSAIERDVLKSLLETARAKTGRDFPAIKQMVK